MPLTRDAQYFDNLPDSEREVLYESMRRMIARGTEIGWCRWNIPNDDHPERMTYGFPSGDPRVWMTLCDWRNRWALCIALAGARSRPADDVPIDVAFELAFYKSPKDVRLNFHLRREPDGRIQMRCKGAFSFRGAVRHPAGDFFSHLKKRKNWGASKRIERFPGGKSYFLLYELPSAELTECWDGLWPALEEFAIMVEDFKSASQGKSLKHVRDAMARLPSGGFERLSEVVVIPDVYGEEARRQELAHKYSGGESQTHADLKNYLARHPEQLGLDATAGRTEYRFATGDRVDLLVRDRNGCAHAVEVEIGGDAENRVGMMQALKYRALLSPAFELAEEACYGILAAHSISSEARELCQRFGIRAVEIPLTRVQGKSHERETRRRKR